MLIEKVRSISTDAQGLYRLIDLRPGNYTVTFTLPGFKSVIREGLELPSNFTATVNAELSVGGLEETITVSGGAPLVDVQSTQRSVVVNRELLDSVPTARNYSGMAALMPPMLLLPVSAGIAYAPTTTHTHATPTLPHPVRPPIG